ncbi:MAG: hypothetical protein IJW64_06810 [Clostridia bacterium]|nr:hypothetical protein [Clostridia bacterium]
MKKLFSSLMALVLTLVLSFSVFACKQKDKTPEPIAIVAVDGVNVQDAIDALGPINESEYLTVNVEFAMAMEEDSVRTERAFDAEVQLKKTNRGYDFIATIEPETNIATSPVPTTVVCYYINGRLVVTYEMMGEIITAEESDEIKTFNELINDLNKEIAEDPEMRETYEQILSVTNEIKALFDAGSLASLDESFDIDVKQDVNDAFTYLKTNAQKTIYNLVIEEAGITKTEQEVEQIIFDVVDELCADNPELSVFIDRVVSAINQELSAEEQINLREIFNAIEAEGLNPVALCELVNQIAGDVVLTPPQTTVSLYDYLMGLIDGITMNDLAVMITGEEGATINDLVADVLSMVKTETVAGVVGYVLGVDLSTCNFNCTDLNASASLKTDSESKLLSLSAEFAVGYSMSDSQVASGAYAGASLSIEISYEQFDTEMVIPQEVLDKLESQKVVE